MMDVYGGHHDYSLFLLDMGASDPALMESLYATRSRTGLIYGSRYYTNDDADDPPSVSVTRADDSRSTSPPKHRHDGTSPLPLGMDWSPPPHLWDGRNAVWPHDCHSGWSYCVTVPFWTITPSTTGSDFVVFYRVQVGIQSPGGVTSALGVLRRFSDFLKLFSELKKAFPKKKLPPAPSKHPLRSKSKELLEDRRSLLEDWITKLLSDIEMSRSFAVANFLELEAAARLSFHESYQNASDGNSSASSMVPSDQIIVASDNSLVSGMSFASDFDGDSESSRVDMCNFDAGTVTSHKQESAELANADEVVLSRNGGVSPPKTFVPGDYRKSSSNMESLMDDNRVDMGASQATSHNENDKTHTSGMKSSDQARLPRKLSNDTLESEISSGKLAISELDFPHDLSIIIPTEEQHKMEKFLTKMQQRIATSKIDVEDLVARLNQELAVRWYLSTKVKDLEIELEATKQNKEETVQQAILIERERVTQLQWDIEELRRKCIELEVTLKHEQEEKVVLESTKSSIIQENESLRQEVNVARDWVEKLQKHCEESESKSKLDVKILAKEIKSLRSSQLELMQELSALKKEKIEMETILQEEKKRRECATATNSKLLHECEILCSRLEECSVDFQTDDENKLTLETSSASDAADTLTVSDNRIGLLVAEAQLLAQEVENTIESSGTFGAGETDVDKLRKMLTDVFIDNATLRKQINSVIRCALRKPKMSDKDGEETSVKDTLLGKFLDG